MLNIIKKKLALKVLIPLSAILILVITANIFINISFQSRSLENQLETQSQMLVQAVEGGMFDALAIGDNDTVRRQFSRLNEKVKGLKVYVYDFNGAVVFSTDLGMVGQKIDQVLGDDAVKDVAAVLETGKNSNRAYHAVLDEIPFLVENISILNEQRCHHCHGASRKVLGGISVFSSELSGKQAIGRGKNVSLLIGFAGLAVLILFIMIYFHFMVHQKVQMVLTAASHLRQKDFTHTYEIKEGDEINYILARINLVTQELRQVLGRIIENTDQVQAASADMKIISAGLENSSTEAAEKVSTVSSASEEMSISNRSLAASMDESTSFLTSVAASVEEVSATVGEIARNISSSKEITDRLVSEFQEIRKIVDDLGHRTVNVDSVTNEIRSIAAQVSMLALNAKIESARAGEAGKGFAIVAQEITELAADTSKYTLEADETLQWIKDQTFVVAEKVNGVSSIIQDSDDAISSISAAVEEQDTATKEIAKNIGLVSGEITQMNANVKESASVAGEIAKEIMAVEQVSKDVHENSGRLGKNAAALSKMAEGFKEMMKMFKV